MSTRLNSLLHLPYCHYLQCDARRCVCCGCCAQACKWSFLAFKGTFSVALNVNEEAVDRLLVFRLQESSFMKDFEGRWQVRMSQQQQQQPSVAMMVVEAGTTHSSTLAETRCVRRRGGARSSGSSRGRVGAGRGRLLQRHQQEAGGADEAATAAAIATRHCCRHMACRPVCTGFEQV
jgi:hypothetical protein